MRSRLVGSAGLVIMGLFLAACGGGGASPSQPATPSQPAASASQAQPKPLESVSLRFDWLISGYHAPFVLAKEKGYYRTAGFDVTLGEGKGSGTTTQTVGSGADTFGLVDAGTAALLISMKVVGVFVQQSPIGFVYHPGDTISTPRDLIGHTIITGPASAGHLILPALLTPAGVQMSQLTIDNVDANTYPQAYERTPRSAVIGWVNTDYQRILKVDPKAQFVSYAKLGLNMYNIALITSETLIQQHPDEVKAFVGASVKGWQDTIKDPHAAVDATLKAFPNADQFQISDGLKRTLDLLHTPTTEGHPVGWTADSDWQKTLETLQKYMKLETVKPLGDYYTNAYLPQS